MARACNFLTVKAFLVTFIFQLSFFSTHVVSGVAEDSNKLFDWAEANYPHLFSPPSQPTLEWNQYLYRYYPAMQNYVGVDKYNLTVHVLGDAFGSGVKQVDTLQNLLAFLNANPVVTTNTGSGGCVKPPLVASGTRTINKLYDGSGDFLGTSILTYQTVTNTYLKFTEEGNTKISGASASSYTESETTYQLRDGYWYEDMQRWSTRQTTSFNQFSSTSNTVIEMTYGSPGIIMRPEIYCQGKAWDTGNVKHTLKQTFNGQTTTIDGTTREYGVVEAVDVPVTTPAGTFNTVRIKISRDNQGHQLHWYDTATEILVLSMSYDVQGKLTSLYILDSIE